MLFSSGYLLISTIIRASSSYAVFFCLVAMAHSIEMFFSSIHHAVMRAAVRLANSGTFASNVGGAIAVQDGPTGACGVDDNMPAASDADCGGGMRAGKTNSNRSVISKLIFALQNFAVGHCDCHRSVP